MKNAPTKAELRAALTELLSIIGPTSLPEADYGRQVLAKYIKPVKAAKPSV